MKPKPFPWYFRPIMPVLNRFLQWLESRGLLKFTHHISAKAAGKITQQFLADTSANDDAVNRYLHTMEEEVIKHPPAPRAARAARTKGKAKSGKTKASKKKAAKAKSKKKASAKKKVKRKGR